MATIQTQAPVERSTVMGYASLSMLAAAAVNLAVFGVASAVDVNFEVTQSGAVEVVVAGAVVVVTILAMALAWALVPIGQWWGRPTLRTIEITAVVFAVFSLLIPLGAEADGTAKFVLATLHLIAAAIFVAGVEGLHRDQVVTAR